MNNEKKTSSNLDIKKTLHTDIDYLDILSEDETFEIMDSLEENQQLGDNLKLNIDDNALEEGLDFDSIKENVRNKTFEKLGISVECLVKSTTSKKEKFYKTILFRKLAATAAAIVIIIGIFSSDYVTAAIGKLLQYIPGLNITLEQEDERFILKDTINITKGDNYIKLLSVIVDNKNQSIYVSIRGNNKKCKNVSVKFKNGKEYDLPIYSVGSGGSDWVGDYSYNPKFYKPKKDTFTYMDGDELNIILNDKENMLIPVKLEKPDTLHSYDELGPTVNKNGLSITAIPTLNNNELEINLLTPNIAGGRVDEYALQPDYKDNEYRHAGLLAGRITLKDKEGNILKGRTPNSLYTPPLSEFYFDISGNNNKEFKLAIPYVKVKYEVKKDIKIVLPEVGKKLEYENNTIDLKGYKLKINSIERPENTRVIINFDTNYNEEATESLLDIYPAVNIQLFGEPIYDSWSRSYEINATKTIGPMNKLDIELNKKNLHQFNLYIETITTVKRGPWEFDINLDKLNK